MRSKSMTLVLGLAGALTLSACGSAAGTGPTVLSIPPTNFEVLPTTPTTAAPTTDPNAPVGPSTDVGTYVLTTDDIYPSRVANKFKVTLAALLEVNGLALDASGQQVPNWPKPGETIKLPIGYVMPGTSTGTTLPSTSPGTSAPTNTTTTLPPTGCAPGKYTLKPEDTTRIKVAEKFGITYQQLDEANKDTQGYSMFYPGLVIVIPAKSC